MEVGDPDPPVNIISHLVNLPIMYIHEENERLYGQAGYLTHLGCPSSM